jgi:hypothetical protein
MLAKQTSIVRLYAKYSVTTKIQYQEDTPLNITATGTASASGETEEEVFRVINDKITEEINEYLIRIDKRIANGYYPINNRVDVKYSSTTPFN